MGGHRRSIRDVLNKRAPTIDEPIRHAEPDRSLTRDTGYEL